MPAIKALFLMGVRGPGWVGWLAINNPKCPSRIYWYTYLKIWNPFVCWNRFSTSAWSKVEWLQGPYGINQTQHCLSECWISRWYPWDGTLNNHPHIHLRWPYQRTMVVIYIGGVKYFFIFNPIWGNFPFWLIFFRWVETTNQIFVLFYSTFSDVVAEQAYFWQKSFVYSGWWHATVCPDDIVHRSLQDLRWSVSQRNR